MRSRNTLALPHLGRRLLSVVDQEIVQQWGPSLIISPCLKSNNNEARLLPMKMLKSLLFTLACAVVAAQSFAYDCSTVPQFANGSQYATGAVAKNVNHAYQCTVGGWC